MGGGCTAGRERSAPPKAASFFSYMVKFSDPWDLPGPADPGAWCCWGPFPVVLLAALGSVAVTAQEWVLLPFLQCWRMQQPLLGGISSRLENTVK